MSQQISKDSIDDKSLHFSFTFHKKYQTAHTAVYFPKSECEKHKPMYTNVGALEVLESFSHIQADKI